MTAIPETLLDGVTIVSIAGLAGAGCKWLWGALTKRLDDRAVQLDAREKAFEEARDSRIVQLEKEVERLAMQMQGMLDVQANLKTAVHLLVTAVIRHEPNAPEVLMAEQLLGKDFPLPLTPSLHNENPS